MKNTPIIMFGLIAALSACGPSAKPKVEDAPELEPGSSVDVAISEGGTRLKATISGTRAETFMRIDHTQGSAPIIKLSRNADLDYAGSTPSGTASSQGDYYGVFMDPSRKSRRVVTGVANIEIDFGSGDGSISGSITDRDLRFQNDEGSFNRGDVDETNLLSDIQLPAGDLTAVMTTDLISGISGGKIYDGDDEWDATSDGNYIAWAAEVDGSETVGSLVLTHNKANGEAWKEEGVFVTTSD